MRSGPIVRHTLLIMLAVLLSAGGVMHALLVVASDVRHVSDELEVANRDMSGIADDVRSLADDVNAIADALAGEDDDDDSRQAPAAVSETLGPASADHAASMRPNGRPHPSTTARRDGRMQRQRRLQHAAVRSQLVAAPR